MVCCYRQQSLRRPWLNLEVANSWWVTGGESFIFSLCRKILWLKSFSRDESPLVWEDMAIFFIFEHFCGFIAEYSNISHPKKINNNLLNTLPPCKYSEGGNVCAPVYVVCFTWAGEMYLQALASRMSIWIWHTHLARVIQLSKWLTTEHLLPCNRGVESRGCTWIRKHKRCFSSPSNLPWILRDLVSNGN